jgi:two-component system nitrogen regulation sensor histidine kinase NtrY
MIGRSLWKLSVERRSKVLGAKFRTKLVAAFVGLSFIPTILLFIFGSGMYTRGIERLFSLRLEVALRDSVTLSQTYYDQLRDQALGFARQVSSRLIAERRERTLEGPELREFLAGKAAEYGVGAAAVFGTDHSVLAQVVTGQYPARSYTRANADLINKALSGQETTAVVNLPRTGDIVRAVVPAVSPEEGKIIGAVAVSYYVPESHARKIDDIRSAYSEYRASFKNKNVLKMSYRLSFLAVMLTLLLAAIWIALRVAGSITVPIRKLAEGTVEVAAGNLDYRIEEQAGDEVGLLVESFNRMTSDLQHSSERLRQEMSNREIILTSIDAGVISLDRPGRIVTVNPAAARILDIRPEDVLERRYDEAFGFIDLKPIRNLFRRLEEGLGRAEEVLTLSVRGRSLTLRLRVSTLRDGSGTLQGSVITFDDLTELLRAKNAETWQDVAQKIAHEVKNPLTPIKLSTERLRKKFLERTPDFEGVFDESSTIIIQEVKRLENLLEEFSRFARMPRPNPVPHRLQPVVESGIALYAGTHRDVTFRTDMPPDLPEILLDAEQMKLVFINLFKNAIEVMENGGMIHVSARVLEGNGMVRIEVADDGPGIPPEDMPRLFEPYFSRKRKGGGLGLAIVERIIADHRGSIHAAQNQPKGARFVIDLPVSGRRAGNDGAGPHDIEIRGRSSRK